MYAEAKKNQIGGIGNGIRNLQSGVDIITKVYPTDIIPDKKIAEQSRQRGVFRQNNFLNDPYVTKQLGLAGQQDGLADGKFMGMKYDNDDQDDNLGEELEVELTE